MEINSVINRNRLVLKQLKNEISDWKERMDELSDLRGSQWECYEYFQKYYFGQSYISDKIKKIKELCHDRDFNIKISGFSNEKAIRLFHASRLDLRRMKLKLTELNIKIYEVRTETNINQLNKHGNYRTVYYKNQEIIY